MNLVFWNANIDFESKELQKIFARFSSFTTKNIKEKL